jgi:cap1 methyltransferase
MKRQRQQQEERASVGRTPTIVGNDCYDEIMNESCEGNISVHNSWLVVGDQIIDEKSTTCLSDEIKSLSQQLLQVKRRLWPAAEDCANAWKSTPQDEFWNARAAANPMEPLGEARHGGLNKMFINRSAIKLANLDAILDFQLTAASATSDFLFVDLCGAPGGFSEYLMKRCQSNGQHATCRGYAMSLVGGNEHGTGAFWRLRNQCYNNGIFHCNYLISNGSDGTGDIYKWDNLIHLQKEMELDMQTAGIVPRKVDLVVADGGFDAQRDSECQEEIAQKLILCECAAGLYLLHVGGSMIVKLFGCQTESIRMAMRSLHDSFEWIREFKPISSRPASSERYAIFMGFRGLPSLWNGGPNWISNVLIGGVLVHPKSHYAEFDEYLDRFDRDMLLLNLKACFQILTTLERKTGETTGRNGDWQKKPLQHSLNVKIFKHAWRLFL